MDYIFDSGPDLGGGSWVPEPPAPAPPPPPHPAPKMYPRLIVCFMDLPFSPLLVCLLFLTAIMNKGNRGRIFK